MIEILTDTLHEFWRILPVLLVAIVVSQIAEHWLQKRNMHHRIGDTNTNIIRAGAIGIATPGPLIAYLPTVRKLARQGVPPSVIGSFITGQTLVGPMRVFLEVSYFGAAFFIMRAAISLLMAIGVGYGMHVINRFTPLFSKHDL